MASHCHQVKDKRLSLVLKASPVCLPTVALDTLCFRPILRPFPSVLPAVRCPPTVPISVDPNLPIDQGPIQIPPLPHLPSILGPGSGDPLSWSLVCSPQSPTGSSRSVLLQPVGSGALRELQRCPCLSLTALGCGRLSLLPMPGAAESGRRMQLRPRCVGSRW